MVEWRYILISEFFRFKDLYLPSGVRYIYIYNCPVNIYFLLCFKGKVACEMSVVVLVFFFSDVSPPFLGLDRGLRFQNEERLEGGKGASDDLLLEI